MTAWRLMILCVLLGACSGAADDEAMDAATDGGHDDLHLPALAKGYVRYEVKPVDVPAQSSDDWAQWIGGPLDQDYDVLDIQGAQGIGGHHALVYATNEAHKPGFTRLWEEADQLKTRLMGGVGGEGGATAMLPDGVVFRVKKGSYLLVQTHYLNISDEAFVGRTVIDIKLAPVDPSRRVASIFANTTSVLSLPAGEESTATVSCDVQEDLRFIQVSNHMHDWGKTTVTEYLDASGKRHEIKRDEGWTGDLALSPNFDSFPEQDPLVVPAGSKLLTHCTWDNTTDRALTFPTEMCVFFGFILNEADIYCESGTWQSAREGSQVAVVGGIDQCLGKNDRAVMGDDTFEAQSTTCATQCGLASDIAACAADCFEEDVDLSAGCAACNGIHIACGAKHCLSKCLTDKASDECRTCVSTHCDAAYFECTGLPQD